MTHEIFHVVRLGLFICQEFVRRRLLELDHRHLIVRHTSDTYSCILLTEGDLLNTVPHCVERELAPLFVLVSARYSGEVLGLKLLPVFEVRRYIGVLLLQDDLLVKVNEACRGCNLLLLDQLFFDSLVV